MMSIPGNCVSDTTTQLLNELKDINSKTERSIKKPKYSMNEEIAVSGISGRYPDIEEFSRNLYDNINLISDDERRWPRDFYGLPVERGKLKNIHKFDMNFFGVSDLEAEHMDTQIRIMLELTYEAIWDSGTDPNLLIGSNTGVFIGNIYDEYLSAYSKYPELVNYKQFMAQTISQKFYFNGPSMVIDTSCASRFSALNEAVIALRNNRCDNTIVAGLNIALNPSGMTKVAWACCYMKNGIDYTDRPNFSTSLQKKITQIQEIVEEIAKSFHQMVETVIACHEVGVVHRDPKAGNIFVETHTIKIIDFDSLDNNEDGVDPHIHGTGLYTLSEWIEYNLYGC